MARNMVEHLIDDLSGEEVETLETVRILGDDDRIYEIDLGKENLDDYHEFRGKYQDKAKFVGTLGKIRPPEPAAPVPATGRRKRKTTSAAAAGNGASPNRMDRAEATKMREWARTHGWPELSDRGRVPADVKAAYENRATD